MADLEKFLEDMRTMLSDTFQKAGDGGGDGTKTTATQGDEVTKMLSDLQTQLATITKALAPGDENGEGAGPVVETLNTLGEALNKALDRIAALEKGTAIRKSLIGSDNEDEELRKAKAGVFDSLVGSLISNPGTKHSLV